MQQKEWKTVAGLVTGVLVLAAYGVHILRRWREGALGADSELRVWASAMLLYIGIGIVVTIVIQILFQIIQAVANEVRHEEGDDPSVEDEMDKLIGLKATRNGYAVAGFGFVASLVLLALRYPPAFMLNTAFVSFHLAGLCEAASSLYFYRRGVRHG